MPWKKGQSGNIKGMPPGTFSLVNLIKRELQKKPEGEKEDYATKGIKEYVRQFGEGKPEIVKDGIDRIDGKPTQAISGPGGGDIPVLIRVKYE